MKKSLLLTPILFLSSLVALGQTADIKDKLNRAEELREQYRFNEAITIYQQIKATPRLDSALSANISSLIAQSENGINMLKYAKRPKTTGSISIPKKNFYLYLPGIQAWSALPDSIAPPYRQFMSANSVAISPNSLEIIYSAPTKEGDWDLFSIKHIDGNLWSSAKPLKGLINSIGDELFPVLSSDGMQLFFASNGHFGMGGFDIYVSNWNPAIEEWELPHNIGFPYSSVEDDLLMYNSDDGLYTYLVSSRANKGGDSLTLYRLEYEATPVTSSLSSVEEAAQLASLRVKQPESSAPTEPNKEVINSPERGEYSMLILKVRELQNEIDSVGVKIDGFRKLYASLNKEEDKLFLEKRITEAEFTLIEMQAKLRATNELVEQKEMEFLIKGALVPRREEFLLTKDKEEAKGERYPPIEISKNTLLPFPQIRLMPKIELFDYSFKVAEESVMAEDQSFPEGLIYRIQLFAVTTPNKNLKSFKGLRPIFESRNASGRYLYSVGQFFSFEEASKALSVVQKKGFASAIIAPYNNGKSMTIANARKLEKNVEQLSTYQIKIEEYPAGLPQPVLEIIRTNSDKDIAKKVVEGREIFFIGPFSTKQEAEKLVIILNNIGANKVTLEEIPHN